MSAVVLSNGKLGAFDEILLRSGFGQIFHVNHLDKATSSCSARWPENVSLVVVLRDGLSRRDLQRVLRRIGKIQAPLLVL